jgi:hypothetical protein
MIAGHNARTAAATVVVLAMGLHLGGWEKPPVQPCAMNLSQRQSSAAAAAATGSAEFAFPFAMQLFYRPASR